MSETRKQRTPAQLIAETTARLEKLMVRQAKNEAKDDPSLAPLFAELEDQRKIIREAKKGLGDGPQSFDARVLKHEIWIDKIENERSSAQASLDCAEESKLLIEQKITSMVSKLTQLSNSNNSNNATA